MQLIPTPRELAALKARRDFTTFCRAVYPPYQHAPHIGLIATALADVARYLETQGREGVGRLRIELPPRHGKSQLVARLFPAWTMGRNGDLRVILASHGAQLSESHSRYIRNTIRSSTYGSIFPNVRLADDSQARETWDLADPLQGGLLAVGTGGSVTGRGAGLIVCDDLIKSREEVESQAQREKLWDWFTNDLLTRQEPGAAIISIGTRWHTDDILGRLDLQDTGERWSVIRLPALAEENDPLGRELGAALWPVRFDVAALEAQREAMGEYSFAALYQQSPVASSGGIFNREKFVVIDEPPSTITHRVRFWDLAISEKKSADFTVGALVGFTSDKRVIVLDVTRFRAHWQGVMNKIASVALTDGPQVRIGIESVLFSAAAITELIQRPELHAYSIKGVEVHKDKHTRALPLAARVDADMVDVLRRSWTQGFLDELASFPNGRHDDQVDAAASAFGMLPAVQPRDLVFPNFADRHITGEHDYDPGLHTYWSIIDGYARETPRVVLIAQQSTDGAIRIVNEIVHAEQADHAVTIEAARSLVSPTGERYKVPDPVLIQQTAQVLYTLFYSRLNIPITRVDFDFAEAISAVRALLESGRLHIHPRAEKLIAELRAFSYDDKDADRSVGRPLPAGSSGPLALAQLVFWLRWHIADRVSRSERAATVKVNG